MAKDGWQVGLTQVVAAQIRRYRKRRGMSTRALAERCAELGLTIPQPVLSNLELGRRESVSVAELLVLAAALDVPPVELAVPLGRQETVEILPGMELPTWHAARWFRGDTALEIGDDRQPRYEDRGSRTDLPIDVFVVHDRLMKDWLMADGMVTRMAEILTQATRSPQDAADQASAGVMIMDSMRKFQEQRDHNRRSLVRHRAFMRYRGMILPTLPNELADLDQDVDREVAELAEEVADYASGAPGYHGLMRYVRSRRADDPGIAPL